ncbi:MAG TPA: AAA family ATPase [Ferruginibacter sp.]|nr:AAA family ATPase [Ferruginibacter sp.]
MSTESQTTAENTQPACLVKDIQFFARSEFYKHKASINKYRTRFESGEIRYLYWDIELINLLYQKQNNSVTIKVRCTALTTRKEMYSADQTISFQANEISTIASNSWGTPDPGYWVADQYLWEILLADKVVLSKTIIVDKLGVVTPEVNPYFDLLEVKMYPSYADYRETKEGYRYVSQLHGAETQYLGVELSFKRKFTDAKSLEMKLNIIDLSNGFVSASAKYETSFPANTAPPVEFFRCSYGSSDAGYWKNGSYLLFVSFMDVTIASAQFTVGDSEVAGSLQQVDNAVLNQVKKTLAEKQATTLEEAHAELDKLVGMASVKKSITENIEYLKFNKLRMEKGFADDGQLGVHSVFTGNPGTGKTTVVRLLGKIYNAMGLLTKGHVVEATRADLIGEFIGHTAPKVKAMIEKARGGILFLDEVYALSRGDDSRDFGAEAVEILLKEMSDGPGNIAIIGAGYPNEVNAFLNSNPGLKSRFSQRFHFDDYMPAELMQIAQVALQKEQASLSPEAEQELNKRLTSLYRNRDKNFGNGRLVFGIIDEAKRFMGVRLLKKQNLDSLTAEELSKIELEDLVNVFEEEHKNKLVLTINQAELDEALQELDRMVGLNQIKQEVRDKIALVRYYMETGKEILNKFSLHAILTGNPGTGKTTLARLLGKIYKALGLLERGHVVEVDRQNLVAAYVGQTAIKTSEAINQAMGGVLFIDEAYSLADGGDNDFGSEAIETLLKMMEDNRGKFAVLAAGYPDNMHQFVRSNPGLQSRFDVTYNLPDYSFEELFAIAQKLLALHDLEMDTSAADHVSNYLKNSYENRDKFFGNARFVRQSVESIVTRQNLRMAALPREQRTLESMRQVLLDDVSHLQEVEKKGRPTIGFKNYN